MPSPLFYTRPRNVFWFASLCCLLWGSAYPSIKLGYALLGVGRNDLAAQILFAGCRFLGAGALLLAYAKFNGKPLGGFPPRQWGELLLLGLFQTTLQYIFFYIGLAHTTGVKASILNASGVFFSVLLAHFLYHNDTLTWRKVLGCLLGLAGVLVVNLNALQHSKVDHGGLTLLGEGFVVLAAFVLSSASLYGKRISQGMDTVVMTGYQLGVGGLALACIGTAAGGHITTWTISSSVLLGYLALLSAVAFALWGMLLRDNRVSTVAVYSFLVPVFGACLSALFLHESLLEWKYLAALVLVSVGIAWVMQEK